MYVVIVDTVQIQPYIFGSNRLKENIGASWLVAQATDDWAEARLPSGVERLYAGGGNFVARAEDEASAKQFGRELSKKALLEAPGLQLAMTYREREKEEGLATAVSKTFTQLAKEKQARAHREPLLGLGVTVMCRSTALPAVDMTEMVANDPNSVYPASAEILAKLGVNDAATKRLIEKLPPPEGFAYPRYFDDMGREKGEQSYIAIVHADGNGIGKKFQAIIREHQEKGDDEAYLKAVRSLSDNIKEASRAALQATLHALHGRICHDEPVNKDAIRQRNAQGNIVAEVMLKKEGGKIYLPFRPLVFGGDDVTFVCDGRLGISLAAEYLRQFEEQTEAIIGEKLTACAGIAIVKSHYPFARAYGLADGLCSSAKKYRQQQGLDASCLDWHFALTGLSGDIGEIRKREYTTYQQPEKLKEPGSSYKGEHLTLRPLTLNGNPNETHRSFNVVLSGVTAFQDLQLEPPEKEPKWSTRRNKVKALREALRGGPAAVRRFKIMYDLGKLPAVDASKNNDFQSGGWWADWCGYFDAIEMMDWFIPLEATES